jgi:antirestriction protein ArdC
MTAAAETVSLHDTVTNRIIHELEQGRVPWVQPWASSSGGSPLGLPQNASTGRTYSGINILLLWFAAIEQGRPSQRWLTYQTGARSGRMAVRKGEKGTMVVYADTFIPKAEQEKASASGEDARRVGFLKRFTVFHVRPVRWACRWMQMRRRFRADRGVASCRSCHCGDWADIRIGGEMAFYSPSHDFIQVPPQEAYFEPINWYRTVLHEAGHWSGHPSRLNRDFSGRYGSEAYAREELVAELCSAFLCAELGVVPAVRHADYLGAWLQLCAARHKSSYPEQAIMRRSTAWD